MKIKAQDIFTQDSFQLFSSEEDKTNKKTVPHYAKALAVALTALSFSMVEAIGTLSPFTCAFLSVIRFDYCFVGFLFSSLGYFVSHPWQGALKYIISSALVCLLRLFVIKAFPHRDKNFLSYGFSFAALFIPGCAYLFFTDFNIISFLLVISESLLGLCAAVCFSSALRVPLSKTDLSRLSIRDTCALALSAGIFLMCLSGLSIEGIAPARILSGIIIMFFALYKGSSAAALTGVFVGAALCIDPGQRYLFPCFALSGLICGVFSPLGQLFTAIAYGVSFLSTAVFAASPFSLTACAEVIIATAGFMIIPSGIISRCFDRLNRCFARSCRPVPSPAGSQLLAAAQGLYDVEKIICRVSERLDSIINPEVNKLFACLQQTVCADCESKSRCWNKLFDSTAADLLCLMGIEKAPPGRLPLEKRCKRREALLQELEQISLQYSSNMAAKMKNREMRRFLTDQFSAMGDFLSSTAEKMQKNKIPDTTKSNALRQALEEKGIYADEVTVFTDSSCAATTEISFYEKTDDTDTKVIKQVTELIVGEPFLGCETSFSRGITTLTLCQKAPYKLTCGFAQIPLKEGSLCGDSLCLTENALGSSAVILSDGMGTGSRAAIDSNMTCAIAESLIKNGFDINGAVKIINSAMIMKSTDESIATLDCVSVNTYSGLAEFYKSGAAISFIRQGDEISIVRLEALPLGIIRGVLPATEKRQLKSGDIILMISDGVTAKDCGWINDELLSWSTSSMPDLAKHIASLAKLRSDKDSRDDISVAAIKLTKA